MSENPLQRILIVILMASFALVPMLIYGCGPEWARWDAAQANQYFRLGETENALHQLRSAIGKSPRDPVIKLSLSQRLVELNKPEQGLKLANEVLEAYPEHRPAMLQKAKCQQHLGEFEAALETWLKYDKTLNAFNRGPGTLNEVAYLRALAGKDLNIARKDIQQAINAVNRSVSWEGDDGVRLKIKAIVLAALISRCCDATSLVSPELDRQIEDIQRQVDVFERALLADIYTNIDQTQPSSRIEENRRQLREYEKELATLLTVRALLRQDTGDLSGCGLDRGRVVELGFDSAKLAQALPDEKASLSAVGVSGAWLDTRGFICSQLPWLESETELRQLNMNRLLFNSCYQNARSDLGVALACSQIQLFSLDCHLSNSMDFQVDRELSKKQVTETIAVIRNHLASLHIRAGEKQKAQAQEIEIRKLGFEPGRQLF